MVVGQGLGVHGGKWGSAPYWKHPKLPMAQVRPAGMRQPETWNLLVGCTDNLVHHHINAPTCNLLDLLIIMVSGYKNMFLDSG